MKMNRANETVLYFTPLNNEKTIKLKGVLVQMGIRIKNISPEQVMEPIGSLLGITGVEKKASGEEFPVVTEEMLVMHNFSGNRLDALLLNLRKAGVQKINLKAVVTESNITWTFYQLYEEIKKEHETMEKNDR